MAEISGKIKRNYFPSENFMLFIIAEIFFYGSFNQKHYFCSMIVIGNTLISENVVEKKFVCDLQVCKGECCVAGDVGAPLGEDEIHILKDLYPHYKEYMTAEGIKAVRKHGFYELFNGEYVTPLVKKGKYCVFVYFDGDIAKCAIEKAFLEGKTDFKKPVSCHLYPVRISTYRDVDAVNYHSWHVCNCACVLGEKLNTPVYKFLEEPLVRKYGREWFLELDEYVY